MHRTEQMQLVKEPKKFDVVVSRAVAPLKDLWQWTHRLIRNNNEVKKHFMTPGSDELIPCGLICLKGGDLAQEISESMLRPRIWEIEKLFEEEYFKENVFCFFFSESY